MSHHLPASVVWSQTLADALFAAERRRLALKLEALCKKNQEITGTTWLGFLYDGTWFAPASQKGVVPVGSRTMLHMSLCDEMEAFKTDRANIRRDYDLVKQMLAKLILGWDELQDIRDALPDCVVHFDANLNRLSRQKTEAFTIRQDARAMRQYERIKSTMALYAATNLIY